MKIQRLILVAVLALFINTGCRASEPNYWDFYQPDVTENPDPEPGPDPEPKPEPEPDKYAIYAMSFNIRYINDGDTGNKSWTARRPAVKAMVEDKLPDIMGVQEARLRQRQEMDVDLTAYKSVGVGRRTGTEDDSSGEFMAIYYRTETVNIEDDEWGTFWLSATPQTPSIGWDASTYRTATWAVVTHLESENKFFCVNTHLDHVSTTARANSMELIELKIKELNPASYPTILMGDFNTSLDDAIFNGVKAFMKDARTEAAATDSKNSFNDFGARGMKIDHIFYSGFKALKFETIDQRYEDVPYISDHYPVAAELEFE